MQAFVLNGLSFWQWVRGEGGGGGGRGMCRCEEARMLFVPFPSGTSLVHSQSWLVDSPPWKGRPEGVLLTGGQGWQGCGGDTAEECIGGEIPDTPVPYLGSKLSPPSPRTTLARWHPLGPGDCLRLPVRPTSGLLPFPSILHPRPFSPSFYTTGFIHVNEIQVRRWGQKKRWC